MASMTRSASELIDGDFELDLGHEAHLVFGAAIELGVAALAAVAPYFGDRDALDAEAGERLADLLELVRLDDGNDVFHPPTSLMLRCSSGKQVPCQFGEAG